MTTTHAGPTRRRVPALCLLLVGSLSLGLAGGADRAEEVELPTPRDLPAFGDEIAVGWVHVPVVVRSGSRYVADLSATDFELRVDGSRVEPDIFGHGAEGPVSLVFLQDLSGSMALGSRLRWSQQVVGCFLGQQQPADEFAVVSFSRGEVRVDVPFTPDRMRIRRAKRGWVPRGDTPLHDAVATLPAVVAEAANPKRAAILLTDGADNRSVVRPGEAIQRVRLGGPPVYVFAFEDYSSRARLGLHRHRDLGLLAFLAANTGGRYLPVLGERSLWRACGEVLEELRHQYVLGFPTRGSGEVAYRELQVSVKRPNVDVLTRHGYHGRAPAS